MGEQYELDRLGYNKNTWYKAYGAQFRILKVTNYMDESADRIEVLIQTRSKNSVPFTITLVSGWEPGENITFTNEEAAQYVLRREDE